MEQKIKTCTDIIPMSIMPQLQLLSVKDVCRILNVGSWMVHKLIGEKKLGSITIGTRRLIPAQALIDFIEQRNEEANNA